MKTTSRTRTCLICTVLFLAAGAYGASSRMAPYTDNPLVETLAQQRFFLTLATQADTASNDHDTLSFLGSLGLYLSDAWTAGAYGSVRGSDRRYPYRVKEIYGFGAFTEYNLAPEAAVQPFGGMRLGILDTSGPASLTSMHLAGLLGVKIPLTAHLSLSGAGVINWADEEILDYTQSADGSYEAENHDVSVELGLRYTF